MATKQDSIKKIVGNLSKKAYKEAERKLKSIEAFAASECVPMNEDMIAVMTIRTAKAMETVFNELKLDYHNDENLKDTPMRVASMYVNELMVGRYTPPPRIEAFPADYYYINKKHINQEALDSSRLMEYHMELDRIQDIFYGKFERPTEENEDKYCTAVLSNGLLKEAERYLDLIEEEEIRIGIEQPKVRNLISKTVDVNSLCSHHLISFVSTDEKESKGVISYIPKIGEEKALLGISKLQRIANWFGRRPQLQETLNWQVKTFLCLILRSKDVMVSFENIIHYCEKTRGVESHCGSTSSIEFGGRFNDSENRDLAFKISRK